jgi:hypothetical protein
VPTATIRAPIWPRIGHPRRCHYTLRSIIGARTRHARLRQYLCRAKFQYRGVDGGDGLMRRIGQRRSRAWYTDCARQAVDVRVGSGISRAPSVAQ